MMPTYEIILKPKSFIQSFQTPSLPPSTTLFGAICWGIRAIYGESELEKLLDNFTLDSRFCLLSSAFPLVQNNDFTVRLFPKPKFASLGLKEIEELAEGNKLFHFAKEYKSFRKIAFVSESLFSEILQGKGERDLFLEYLNGDIKNIGNWALKKEEFSVFATNKVSLSPKPTARNKIDRLISSTSGTGEFFYDFRLFYPPPFSSFFLLSTQNISFFEPVFKYLEDSGIGGERTIGLNHFFIEIKEAKLNLPLGGRKLVTLSRWRVDPEELDQTREEEFHYELLPLRAKVETGFDFKDKEIVWKAKTLYFAEGSILVAKEKQNYYGGLWQSCQINGKRIRDYGIAFPAFFEEQ